MSTDDLTGDVIESMAWDPEFLRLQIDTRGGWYLEVENDFVVTDGAVAMDSRSAANEAVAILQAWASGTVSTFDVSDNGSLRMSVGAVTLTVDPAYDYEAWHATGPPPEKHMIICQPGGGIA